MMQTNWIILVLEFAGFLVSSMSAHCQYGWHEHGNYCYRAFGDRTTYDSSLSACAAHLGSLVIVPNAAVNQFLKTLIKSFVDDTFWLGLIETDTGLRWINGEPVTWTLWAPSSTSGRPGCSLLVRGQFWTLDNCEHIHQYICQMPRFDATTTKRPVTTTMNSNGQTSLEVTEREPVYGIDASATHIPDMSTSRSTILTSLAEEKTTTLSTEDIKERTVGKIERGSDKDKPAATQNTLAEEITVKRKKNPGRTMPDNRPSAIGIGGAGVFIIVAILAGIILLDASKLYKDFKVLVRNVKSFLGKEP